MKKGLRKNNQNKLENITIHILLVLSLFFVFTLNTNVYSQADRVNGNLIQLNDNGAWCWYQDERVIIDNGAEKIIAGSDGSDYGFGGTPRDGDVEAVIFDMRTGSVQKSILKDGSSAPSSFYADDHNAPAFIIRPDGKYLTMYAAHFNDTSSYYRIYDNGTWGAEKRFNWKIQRPGGVNFQATYSNLFYMSSENRMYNIVRQHERSPNSMISSDMGNTWTYGGLVTKPDSSIGYVNGYFKYWGNGLDRIDFVCTEHHPRDYNTSIYHGFIRNGKSYKSDGTLMDNNIFDSVAPKPAQFTRIFQAGTTLQGFTLSRCWTVDVVRYADGSIAGVIKVRINDTNPASSDPEHGFVYVRFNGTEWKSTFLGKAGKKLYSSEEDYTGLAAMHPDDPNTIFISSTYDPRTNSSMAKHEIFQGQTTDMGQSWTWTPVTYNSTRDNLRPVVAKWQEGKTALLWFRGTYASAQDFDAAVVGVIKNPMAAPSLMTYVDANTVNTTLANGDPLVTTGPDPNMGASDNKWHTRTGYGNSGSIFTSGESGSGENSPQIKTTFQVPQSGTYDVWANFWANPSSDWRLQAGLSPTNVQLYRSMACKQVDSNAHNSQLILTGSGNVFLYQAYIGRVQAAASGNISVYIDDNCLKTATANTQTGDIARTWYDGISYAKIDNIVPVEIAVFTANRCGNTISLQWRAVSEKNNMGFSIERFKFNGEKTGIWETIGFVKGRGSTASPFDYSYIDEGIQHSVGCRYRLKQLDFNGNFCYSQIVEIQPNIPQKFILCQNYPNPFNPSTTIQFELAEKSNVSIKVFNTIGEEMQCLLNGVMEAGIHKINWDAEKLPAGLYVCRVDAGSNSAAIKMILMK